jgi:hypothetical protein
VAASSLTLDGNTLAEERARLLGMIA